MIPAGVMSWRVLQDAALSQLQAAGVEDAAGKLRWWLAHVRGMGLSQADVQRMDAAEPPAAAAFEAGVQRLLRHEPVQYVMGETEFMGLRFFCEPCALIPRPETELLVETALDWLKQHAPDAVVVDVGTGTGCIACSLAHFLPSLRVVAVDVSPAALALARRNAAALGVQVDFRQGDLLAGVAAECAQMVVSNPPYIASAECDGLSPTVRDFEPRLALDGGPDGLQLISRLAEQAAFVLPCGGRLVLEIGEEQAAQVTQCLNRTNHYHPPQVRSDYAGHLRIVQSTRRR